MLRDARTSPEIAMSEADAQDAAVEIEDVLRRTELPHLFQAKLRCVVHMLRAHEKTMSRARQVYGALGLDPPPPLSSSELTEDRVARALSDPAFVKTLREQGRAIGLVPWRTFRPSDMVPFIMRGGRAQLEFRPPWTSEDVLERVAEALRRDEGLGPPQVLRIAIYTNPLEDA